MQKDFIRTLPAIWPGDRKVPALISTIENFLDIHGKATKSGDFSPNSSKKKIVEIFCVNDITGCHGNTIFNVMFGEILLSSYFASNTNEIFQTIFNS